MKPLLVYALLALLNLIAATALAGETALPPGVVPVAVPGVVCRGWLVPAREDGMCPSGEIPSARVEHQAVSLPDLDLMPDGSLRETLPDVAAVLTVGADGALGVARPEPGMTAVGWVPTDSRQGTLAYARR